MTGEETSKTALAVQSNGAVSNSGGSPDSYESRKAQMREDIAELSRLGRIVSEVALRMGRNLKRIRDSGEYKKEYPTFTDLIKEEYGRERTWAYRAMEIADVCDLLPTGNTDEAHLPSARVFRGLGKYKKDPSLLAVAYRAKLAGSNVEEAVRAALPPAPSDPTLEPPRLTKLEQSRLEREESKRKDRIEGLLFKLRDCSDETDYLGITDPKAFLEEHLSDIIVYERAKVKKLVRLVRALPQVLEAKNLYD